MQRVFGDLDSLLYVDHRLDDERKAAFLAHLAEDGHEAERVALWSRQNDVLRATFANVAVEPVPLWLRLGHVAAERPVLRDMTPAPERRPRAEARLVDGRASPRPAEAAAGPKMVESPVRRRYRSTSIGVSAALLLAIGLLVLVGAHALLPQVAGTAEPAARADGDSISPAAGRAADAYRTFALDPVRPVEIAASQQATLDHWLQRRLGMAVHAPDLHGEGWTALGGRLVPGDAAPAAYYIYGDDAGEKLGVYMARTAGPPTTTISLDPMSGGGSVLSWIDGQTAYAVTTGKSLDWLSRNAEALRTRIDRSAGDDR